MSLDTDVFFNENHVGKNLYRKKTFYTLCIEQEVLAKDKDEADTLFSDFGGINHSNINKDIADCKDGVETYMVDANYTDSDKSKYIGKVVYEDDKYAKEDGMVEIDNYVDEDNSKITDDLEKWRVGISDTSSPFKDYKENVLTER